LPAYHKKEKRKKKPGFVSRPVHVEFVVDKVAFGHVCLRVYILIFS